MWRHIKRNNRNDIQSSLPLRIREQCRLHMEHLGWARRHHCIGVHRLPAGGQIWLSGDQRHRSAINMVSKQTVTSTGSRTALSVLIFGTWRALRGTQDPWIMNLARSMEKITTSLVMKENTATNPVHLIAEVHLSALLGGFFFGAIVLCGKRVAIPIDRTDSFENTSLHFLFRSHELFQLPNTCLVFLDLPLCTFFSFCFLFFYPASICLLTFTLLFFLLFA